MIGVVVATHARVAAELCRAVEMILGPQEALAAVSIEPETSMDAARCALFDSVKNVDDGQGVIIMTDLFGGTPTNLSADLLAGDKVEIITGVNLPMLLKGLSSRNGADLETLSALLKDYARTAIMRPSELLR